MARGWESKAVEDQIAAAEADKAARPAKSFPHSERDRRRQREALLLWRTNLINRSGAGCNERYHAQLKLALEHVESKLRDLDSDEPSFGD